MFMAAKRPAALPVNLRVPPNVRRRESMLRWKGDALGTFLTLTLICGGLETEAVMVSSPKFCVVVGR